MALPLVNATQLVEEIADETGYSKSEVRVTLKALEEVVAYHLKNCDRVRIGQLVQIEPKLRKAAKKRKGRNPATGEEITISAKPASVKVGVRALKGAKDALPSVKKLNNAS